MRYIKGLGDKRKRVGENGISEWKRGKMEWKKEKNTGNWRNIFKNWAILAMFIFFLGAQALNKKWPEDFGNDEMKKHLQKNVKKKCSESISFIED